MTLQVIERPHEKVIFLGDTHIGARNDSQLFHDRFELFYNYMFDYMRSHGIKTIVQFGDLFDRRKYVNFASLKRAREYFFDRLKQYGMNMVVFLGNHDVAFRNTLEVNSPSLLLRDYEEITVVAEPTELNIGKVKLLMVPWICSDNYEQTMNAIDTTSAAYCLGHFELNGFEMYRGATCDHGLGSELFEKFHHVWSGHFHHISTKGNITYIGSPCQLMWSDYGDERGFFVFDPSKQDVDFIKNPYEMFYKINYNDKSGAQTLSDLLKADFSKYAKTYVKVVVVEKTDLYLYDQYIEKLENAGAIVSTVEDHKYHNIETDEEIFEGAEKIDETLKRVASMYKDTVDEKKLFNLLMDLYAEAVNTQSETQ
jgi:DNA repair exonuclease SbcCD nuclease subunit